MFERVLLVDGNHLIYRAFYKFSRLKNLDGKPTGIIYGGPFILESILRRLGPDKVIVVFDHSRSKFRMGLLPSYKDRVSKLGVDKENFFDQRDELITLLTAMGIEVYRVPGYEADDIITYLSKIYYKKGWESIIVSADKDFVQLINNNTSIFNVSKGKMINTNNCFEEYGYTPRQCVDYLSLCGDNSDNIGGYPGIGPARASKLLSEFKSIKAFLRSNKDFSNVDKVKMKAIFELNRKLIDLMYFIRKVLKPEDIKPVVVNPQLDRKNMELICSLNQINFYKKPQFMKTYNDLYHGK
jgi:DNA polymerase-1